MYYSLGTVTQNLTIGKRYLAIVSLQVTQANNNNGLYLITPSGHNDGLTALCTADYFTISLSNGVLSMSATKNLNVLLVEF